MTKITKIFTAVFITVFLAALAMGCGSPVTMVSCPSPASNADIKQFYSQKISAFTSDSFVVTIGSDTPLTVVTKKNMLGPDSYAEVPGGRQVTLTISLKLYDGNTLYITETYEDAYTLNGENHPINATENFIEYINLYDLKKSYEKVMKNEGISDYRVIADIGDPANSLDIFLCCSDYDKVNNVLTEFKTKLSQKHQAMDTYNKYGVYIIPDKAVYDSLPFSDLYLNSASDSGLSYGGDIIKVLTGKSVTRIGSSDDFDRDLFTTNGAAYADTDKEYIDYKSFDYVIFWAYAEPNTPGTCRVQLFGVK